jgi:hypothetical protein
VSRHTLIKTTRTPAGTTLRMARVLFRHDWSPDGTDYLYYIALFVDGPLAGKPALLDRISTWGFLSQSVNGDYLEQVDK